MSNMFTKEQLDVAKKHGLTRDSVYKRVRTLGWSVNKAITTPPKPVTAKDTMKIKGKFVSEKNIKIALDNGIGKRTLASRLRRGMSVEDAIRPLPFNRNEMEENEVKEIIGRLKYLNWTIPKGLVKRASELNLSIDNIKIVEVEIDANEEEVLCTEAD